MTVGSQLCRLTLVSFTVMGLGEGRVGAGFTISNIVFRAFARIRTICMMVAIGLGVTIHISAVVFGAFVSCFEINVGACLTISKIILSAYTAECVVRVMNTFGFRMTVHTCTFILVTGMRVLKRPTMCTGYAITFVILGTLARVSIILVVEAYSSFETTEIFAVAFLTGVRVFETFV